MKDNNQGKLTAVHPRRFRCQRSPREINNSVCERVKKTRKRWFKSAPLDAAVTGPEELVQLKVVIALLIPPINF